MNVTAIPKLMLALLFATSFGLTACGGDDDDAKDTDSVDELITDPAMGCVNATPLTLAVPRAGGLIEGTAGVIDVPGRIEFFSLTLDAPNFVRIATKTAPGPMEEGSFDPAMALYSADGSTLLAFSNNKFSFLAPTLDAELLYNAPEATTLCVAVQDATLWYDWETTYGDPDFTFEVNASKVADNEGYYVATGSNNDVASAQEIELVRLDGTTTSYDTATVCGVFDTLTDADHYKFTNALGNQIVVTNLMYATGTGASGPDGYEGNGSTVIEARLSQVQSDGRYYGSLARSEYFALEVPLNGATTVNMSVEPADDTQGDNDFYCAEYLVEVAPALYDHIEAKANNDLLVDGELIDLEDPNDPNRLRAFVQGTLDTPADVDYYEFDVPNSNMPLTLICASKNKGSGLQHATFAIHDSADVELQSGDEFDAPVIWTEDPLATDKTLIIENSGSHYLRISAATQDADIDGAYYTCSLQLLQ